MPERIGLIEITFHDDVNEDLINLHHHRNDFEVIPELVKHYRIEAFLDGDWHILQQVQNNRQRRRIHRLDQSILTQQLRLVIEETNGCPYAEVIEIRAYA
jgi:hypothetical protein